MKWLIALCGVLGMPASAQAQAADGVLPLQVRCEAQGMGRRHCPIDTSHGVQLVRQLSESTCIRGSEWGVEPKGDGIWVTSGCRAEFRSLRPQEGTLTRRVVRCESNGRKESCPVMLRGAPVRLLRQLSVWPCREGQSWGARRNEIWVSRGCDAEFEIGAEDGSGFVDLPRVVVCESKGRIRRLCGVTVERGVRLGRQISGTPCVQGGNWGWDRDGVWVDGGCRGEFIVD
ncbi:MAG: DUF3011 domain-containing protein [Pseudomonas sp.]